eukprot:TRINITY_DN52963_c0_g1_i1.p1 TRINITY_DN52963_c0_g1~~TRINITY_DN52963_c0_g1_i1.p1  ORF type:complete len:464 (-),score=87.78 TRINITY_DN52963_c0_g1_i1:54-1370(-)
MAVACLASVLGCSWVQLSSLAAPGSRTQRVLLSASKKSEFPAPPGPMALPVLGSLSVIWALMCGRPLPQILRDVRKNHGELFMIKTGPVKQVWVGSVDMLRKVYSMPECCGRPVSFEDPFGNFLFLTKRPEDAAPIKEKQKAWLEKNLKPEQIAAAVEAAFTEQLFPAIDTSSTASNWPRDAVRNAMYSAVTKAILGEAALLDKNELGRLMAATRAYSEMRVKGKFGRRKKGEGPRTPPGAVEIREVVEAALARGGRQDDAAIALPLVVAATVGGAEIFPTLLHWILLRLAAEPSLQEQVRAASADEDRDKLLREVYRLLRRTSYSVALGPPRKVLADAVVDKYCIPEGALLFAMHPALAGKPSAEEDDFSSYAFGVGPRSCLGQALTEAVLPSALTVLLKHYKVSLPEGQAFPEGEMKGQLIRPKGKAELVWERRPS